MKTKTRWIDAVVAASSEPVPVMPWQARRLAGRAGHRAPDAQRITAFRAAFRPTRKARDAA